MKITRYIMVSLVSTAALLLATGCNTGSKSAAPVTSTEGIVSEKEIVDAYVYLLARALAVRQELADFSEPGLKYNAIKYNEAGKADFVNPNLDVAYMEAWFAVDEHTAVILDVPKIENRYYTVQLMDGWGEVLYNINERNFPNHPYGKYALCLQSTTAEIPADAFRIIVPTRKIKMLARVELQNTPENALRLQKQFKASVIGQPQIEPVPAFPAFTNTDLPDLSIFEFAEELMLTPDSRMPDKDAIQSVCKKVAAYALADSERRETVKKVIREKAIPRFMDHAIKKAGKVENNWLGVLVAGEFKGDYWTRTAANFVGIWANSASEVIYFIASKDAAGNTLRGSQSYSIHFTKDKLPASNVDGFWSVILVDFPNYRVADNALKRYNFNNFSRLRYDKDGSLTIYISPEYNSDIPKSNWLPSPRGKEFNLTLRMYLPKEQVKNGNWFPAPVESAN